MNDFYSDAPAWGEDDSRCPHTSEKALPYKPIDVVGRRLIKVRDAMYRRATFSGTFLLSDNVKELPLEGLIDVEVRCLWFGHRLINSEPKFKVDMSTAEILLSGTGFTDFRD